MINHNKLRYFIVCFLILLSNSAFAELSVGKVKKLFKIDLIEIEGNKKVETEAILEKVNLEKGSELDNYALRGAIKRIYSMKYFETVEAHHVKKSGKDVLLFKIKEKPIINKISFSGNDELDDDELKDQVKTAAFNILDVNTIKSDLITLQKFYEEKGYYLANIDYELVRNDAGGMNLTFKIKEYDKVRVKKILFLGNNDLKDEELKSFMQTNEETLFSGLSGSGE